MSIALNISPEIYSLSKNMIHVRLASTSYSGLDNYRAVLRILFEKIYGSNTFTQIVEIEAIPDSSGYSNFYIQDILDAETLLNTPFRVPDIETPGPYGTDTLRKYKLQFLEKYGEPQVEQAATTSSAFYVLLGGVDYHYDGLYDFFDNVTVNNSFLTYIPSGKFIARDAPEVITYLHYRSDFSTFNSPFLRINEYDEDGVLISTFDKYRIGSLDDFIVIDRWQPAVFPTSPAALGIDSSAVKYTVQVWCTDVVYEDDEPVTGDNESVSSQIFTYYITDNYQEQPSDLIWYGSFHNPHVLRCDGRKRTRLLVERQLSEQVTSWGYDPQTGAEIQHRRQWNNLFTFRSGALRMDDVDALQELLIENKIIEHSADGNYYRLLLTDNSYDVFEQKATPNYIEFTARRSMAPGNYMKIRSVAIPPVADGVWETNSNGYWELNTGGAYWQLN